jgi:hypothetical protein
MINEDIKFERILKLLRKSKPVLTGLDEIEDEVMKRIEECRQTKSPGNTLSSYLFGWVYVSWIRRGLIAASVLIVALFAYQQAIILRRVNNLDRQTMLIESQLFSGTSNNLEGKLLFYEFTGRKIRSGNISLSQKQIEQLIDSYGELNSRYRDLLKLIDENPELKKYVEEKLNEINIKKLNL